jgi:hypothetical protein
MPKKSFIISQFNVSSPGLPEKVLDDNYKPIICNVRPRDNLRLFIRNFDKDAREPWSIPISLFKDFRPDTETLEGECFEEDWKNLSVPRAF